MRLEFKLTICDISLVAGSEDGQFLPEFVEQFRAEKFSLTGGMLVTIRVSGGNDTDLRETAYVARRVEPTSAEPSSFAEAKSPEFMDYRAVGPNTGRGNWAADLVNSLIADNYGKLPDGWLERAMEDVGTNGVKH
ncbi:MAG: hypothetical protein JXR35_04095 [Rhodobacteraceae bacterium]|nr:hypothetical protein [Paracoccaceae bacterium]